MQLTDLNLDYFSILPEIITAIAGVLLMLIDAFSKNGGRKIGPLFSLFSLAIALVSIAALWSHNGSSSFAGMIVNDHLRLYFALVVVVCSIIATLMASQFLDDEALPPGEFYALMMFATCGMLMMASAGDLVMVFLGLETSSIATYVMAGYRRTDLRANESSLKYFLLGSFSAAFLLYGMALTYGATGTTNIEAIRQVLIAGKVIYPQMLLVGGAMMLVGFGFKIATAPFHLWTPDVYEGAPTPVTAFFAAAPKMAAMALTVRVTVGAFAPIAHDWQQIVAFISIASMALGSFAAIGQRNIKRLMAGTESKFGSKAKAV